ncbi:hypothetical protein IW139_000511 [Coemansia sp. RSA 353]|nr:hypothetical protein LPJ58_001548 [Coemansia sp. RSA 1591]KAJ1765523.1 hypothetical protein LPJ69_001253 [Coemansia sp. RSA 1752]KAJ1778216.1 hypothetical protein LPJ54_001858 [Coemansia sp. RSA 1824]KAJ2140031.1 hypothetical protein GGH17_000050 [Coemansia sp. RSA 788]KAJ2144589.1 hypothetical protein IW142_003057 [Coemansia sp. RSA 564]KAJ2167772.1 hypothetical protein GGH15_001890 [Coemansia sp. RSA 562]KAJ2181781.1 hypothetical protein GGF45_001319 [Coemansia sp. RSA 551]KAJ2190999.1 
MRKLHDAPFPVIDTDPIFGRVIRYMRVSDYVLGISLTAVGPAFMYWMEKYQPSGLSRKYQRHGMLAGGLVGVCAGFMSAYSCSSARFWGTSENAREIKMYREEYRRLKAEGKSMHGTSSLPLSIQRISSEYSTGAFLNFDVAPWFNFVNHPFHGQSDGVIPDDEK